MKMNARIWTVVVVLLATYAPASAQGQSLTVDDFTAATQNLSVTNGLQNSFKQAPSGSPLIGAARYITFTAKAGVLGLAKPATLDIGGGYLVVQSSIQVFHGIQVFYGVGSNAEEVPLHRNLAGYKRFRLHFLASDLGLNINMQVIAGNNPHPAQSGVNISGHPTGVPFVVDLVFDTFFPGAGPLPDFTDINQIRLFIQSGSAIGANDYALTRIEALP